MEYTLIRSRRKTLAIEIDREGRLIVRAPLRCPMKEIQRFLAEKQRWIADHQARMAARRQAHPDPTPAEEAALREKARTMLPPLVARYAAVMDVRPAGITITGAKTRFGSCSPQNRLCFSFRLMGWPPPAIEYVVVHELAHIRHKNHGPDFYREIEAVLPDWKSRAALFVYSTREIIPA